MSEPSTASRSMPFERFLCEVNSRCASLRAAAGLLPGLPAGDFEEMLRLMVQEGVELARSLEQYRSRSK